MKKISKDNAKNFILATRGMKLVLIELGKAEDGLDLEKMISISVLDM